jgi:hypothetical protein
VGVVVEQHQVLQLGKMEVQAGAKDHQELVVVAEQAIHHL